VQVTQVICSFLEELFFVSFSVAVLCRRIRDFVRTLSTYLVHDPLRP
jgi:hypothetical protein